jgi:hypothetical protein
MSGMHGVFAKPTITKLAATSPWLSKVFTDDKLLFEQIRDAISAVKDKNPGYNPYLYESLMADVSRLLDRCLAYRRECAGLESQAVTRALDYDLFGKMSANETKLNALQTSTASLVDTRDGQLSTAAALNGLASDNLKSFGAAYQGAAKAAGDAIDNQTARSAALVERLNILSDYQANLQIQHTTPGHALNYAERRGRVIELITQDVAEAYQKARAARAGMMKQLDLREDPKYGFPVPAGDDGDVDLLDRLVLWAREMLRVYEVYGEDEIVFDLVVPLATPYFSDFVTLANDKSLYDQAQFVTAMKTAAAGGGQIQVTLKNALPSVLRPDASGKYNPNIRLRGIGLSIGAPSTVDATSSWSAVIFLPPQPSPYDASAGELFPRAPVVLGRLFPYRYDTPTAASAGEEVWNVDPTADDIHIHIAPMALASGATKVPTVRNNALIQDLKLHLKIAARPSKKLADWTAN